MHILFYSLIILTIIVDQLTKYWVRVYLNIGESIEVFEGVLDFTHIKNSGVAFGLLEGYGRLFVPIAVIITVVSIYLLKKGHIHGKVLQIGVALFVGGAIGNAIDRTLFNEVTDFIDFHYNQGILNIADYFLQIGMIFILIDTFILDVINKRIFTLYCNPKVRMGCSSFWEQYRYRGEDGRRK